MSGDLCGFCNGIFYKASRHLSLAEKEIVGTPMDFASPTIDWKSVENGRQRIESFVGEHMTFPELSRGKAHWPVDYVALIVLVPII